MEMFLSNVFYNSSSGMNKLLQLLMLQLCSIKHQDVNKYWQVAALFTPAVSSSGLSPLQLGQFTVERAPFSNEQQSGVSHSRSGDLRT